MKKILALVLAYALVLLSIPAFAADRGETPRNANSMQGGDQTREMNRYQYENSGRSEFGWARRQEERRMGTDAGRGPHQWGFGGSGRGMRGMGSGPATGGFGRGFGGHGGRR